jgi:hypothetical protein
VRGGPKVAVAVIWLEIKLAAFLGLLWFPLGQPMFAMASAPVLLLGLPLLLKIITTAPGPGYNKLLALAAFMLVVFAAVFHYAATIY